MNHRRFNSIMAPINSLWAAEVLRVNVNPNNGADLTDYEKNIELKFKLIHKNKYTHISWRVLEHQLSYSKNDKLSLWGLGKYILKKPISEMSEKDEDELENLVIERELYLVEWNWMNQFQSYEQNRKTDISKWHNIIRFPKFSKLPKTIKSFKVNKGLLHFTEGTSFDIFNLNLEN